MSIKKGDTLIEVAIAIAIFSLVAIGVVSVVNGSTSAAQSALEVTVSREEIDTQAEALRFIQTSYMAGGNSNAAGNDKYKILWEAIKDRAIDGTNFLESALEYNPTTCAELYNNSGTNYVMQKAFVINTHYLGRNVSLDSAVSRTNFANSVIVKADSRFQPTATYPRLLYGTDATTLLDDSASTGSFQRAEGIFIVAVKDQKTTIIVDSNNVAHAEAAFYDFYIRTCWFTPGADRPSTVSTVVRLQDPDTISYDGGGSGSDIANSHTITFAKNDGTGAVISMRVSAGRAVTPPNFTRSGYAISGWRVHGTSTVVSANTAIIMPDYDVQYDAVWTEAVTISFNANGGTGRMSSVSVAKGATAGPFASNFTRAGYEFAGWGKNRTSGIDYSPSSTFTVNGNITLYAIWRRIAATETYTIYFNANGGTGNMPPVTVMKGFMAGPYSSGFARAGYEFAGWSTSSNGGVVYSANSTFTINRNMTLYAVWRELPIVDENKNYVIALTWGNGRYDCGDLDSFLTLPSGGNIYYGNKSYTSGRTSITLNQDGCYRSTTPDETYTLKNIKSNSGTYYFYVIKANDNRAVVQVTGSANYTFRYSNASGSGSYWNVFAIKNGQIVPHNTRGSSAETNY